MIPDPARVPLSTVGLNTTSKFVRFEALKTHLLSRMLILLLVAVAHDSLDDDY